MLQTAFTSICKTVECEEEGEMPRPVLSNVMEGRLFSWKSAFERSGGLIMALLVSLCSRSVFKTVSVHN